MGKKPFSAKAKKQQMQDKKARKRAAAGSALLAANGSGKGQPGERQPAAEQVSMEKYKQHGRERFELRLDVETKATIGDRVAIAQTPLALTRAPTVSEWGVNDSHNDATRTFFAKPPWTTTMTKEELESQEEAAFLQYKTTLSDALGHTQELSYFENNLETWRQLWHVL
eukprot:gene29931-30389_t